MKTLKVLAEEHKCDKAAEGHHTYDLPYHRHFDPLRHKAIKILEIGVGGYDNPKEGGCSLRMWKEYFTNLETQIYGIDIFEKSAIQEDRITIFQGSQSDEGFLKSVIAKIGAPDIILDDGSHNNSDTITSFKVLFPLLANGGIYVIEDMQTAYWRHYGGGDVDNAVDYIKGLIHGLNYKEMATEARGRGEVPVEPGYFEAHILSIHFYHNMVFIYKGDNTVTA